MPKSIKRIAIHGMAVAAGAAAFGVVWLSQSSGAAPACKNWCFQGTLYKDVSPAMASYYAANGGYCYPGTGDCKATSPP